MNPERDDITRRVRKDREGVLGISTPIFRSQGDRGSGWGWDQQRRPSKKDQKGRRKVRRQMFWPSNAAGSARKDTC